ncbi:MAG: hypothetical protein IJV04_02200 [Lachnospiraceae bacterium]|nr:hypothetical protein [Lachnospiraceae bacterium]
MKNQYFGDVGDYGKYGLLRYLAENGIRTGVNWYLTEDDGSNDGRHITYLEKKEYFKYDSSLYIFLKELVLERQERAVSHIEDGSLIPDAVFYERMLDNPLQFVKQEREERRLRWHEDGLEKLKGCDLVFLDPDNGFRSSPARQVKDQNKYCYSNEVRDYFEAGANVFYYTHKGRRTAEQWTIAKGKMKMATPDAFMWGLTFHRGTQRSYIFSIHPEEKDRYTRLLDSFMHTNWKDMFTVEPMP